MTNKRRWETKLKATLLLMLLLLPQLVIAEEEARNPYFENAVTNFSNSELKWRTREALEVIHRISELAKERELTEAEMDAKFWAFQASKAFRAILLERQLCAGKGRVALVLD